MSSAKLTPMDKAVMDVLQNLKDVGELLQEERLFEAEALERHLLAALANSAKPENKVVVSLLHEPQSCAQDKIELIHRAQRYLEAAYAIRTLRKPDPAVPNQRMA